MSGSGSGLLAVAVVALSFGACDSGEIPQAVLAEVTLVSCRPVEDLLSARIDYWSKTLKEPSFLGNSRVDWESSIPSMVERHPGVVLQVQVSSSATISDLRELSASKGITVGEWSRVSKSKQVFSNEFGGTCDGYPLAYTDYFLLTSLVSDGVPPEDLPGFLGLERLTRIPKMFQGYLPRDWRLRRG